MTDVREQHLLAEIGRLHMELLRLTQTPDVPPEGPAVLPVPAGPRRTQRVRPEERS